MKRFTRALLLAVGLATTIVAPRAPVAQEMPLEKASSGAWSVTYGGQHFRVSATVAVKLRFELTSPTTIKVTVVSETGESGRATIYWSEFQKYIFTGQIPIGEPWAGSLDTEGGFVDR